MKKLEELKRMVYVVDMVNGFLKEGNMANPDAMRIVGDITRLLEETRREDEGIAFIKDTHYPDSSEFKKFPVHCLAGSSESEVISEFRGFEEYARSYEKNSTSASAAIDYVIDLDTMRNLEEIFYVGVCSDICVMNAAIGTTNYLDEYNRVVKIYAPENMIDTFNSVDHPRDLYQTMALKLMKQSGINTEVR